MALVAALTGQARIMVWLATIGSTALLGTWAGFTVFSRLRRRATTPARPRGA
jgi:hypothetical protein